MNFRMNFWKRLCLNFSSQRERECSIDPMASCSMVSLGLTFSALLNRSNRKKSRLRLIRARPFFYMTNYNPNVSLWIVDCSLFTRRIARQDDFTGVDRLCWLIHLWSLTIRRLRQRLASFLPTKTSSLKKTFSTLLQFVGLLLQWTQTLYSADHTLKSVHYQQFDLRQKRILRGSQPIVKSDADDNCRLHVTTMKGLTFLDEMSSIPIDDSKDHYVLVVNLTSTQDAIENCQYPELVGEPEAGA